MSFHITLRGGIFAGLGLLGLAACAVPVALNFGDNSSEYANDGECDDPRFIGAGMATSLNQANTEADATDCRTLFNSGRVELVSVAAGKAATQCDAIRYGDDTSEWANDGECDDPRFMGPGASSIMLASDLFKDAKDCRATCDAGLVWLRTAQ